MEKMIKMFRKMARKIHKKIKCQNGSSSIEFALILPVLTLLLLGIFQFGLAYNNFLAITHAAREGARMAAVGQFDESTVRTRAYPVSPTSVTVNYPNGDSHGEKVEVTVRYDIKIDLPMFGVQNIPLVSRARMRIEV